MSFAYFQSALYASIGNPRIPCEGIIHSPFFTIILPPMRFCICAATLSRILLDRRNVTRPVGPATPMPASQPELRLRLRCRPALVPRRRGFDRLKPRQFVVRQRHLDRAGLTWNTADQTAPFEFDDHLVNRWGGDLEEPLEVSLGRRSSVQQRVRGDERQVLTLSFRKSGSRAAGHGSANLIQDFHEHTLSRHPDPAGTTGA